MPNRQAELEAEIVRQCTEDGFLIRLTAQATFDQLSFNKLVHTLEEYDDVLADSLVINRYVAGCLLHLETMLNNAASKFRDLRLPVADKTIDAYAIISDLVHTILVPPNMRGSQDS